NVKTALLTHFGHGPRPLASQAGSAVAARFPRHIEVLQLAAAVFGATAVPFPQQLRRKVAQIVTSSRCSPVLSAKLLQLRWWGVGRDLRMQCVGKNGGLRAGGLRLLLPLFSVAAFLLCGGTPSAFADTCAINDVGITTGSVINTGTINCINIQNSTVSGNVTNAAGGAINATGFFGSPTDTGIVISNNASVSGSVSNAGTITASLAGINI